MEHDNDTKRPGTTPEPAADGLRVFFIQENVRLSFTTQAKDSAEAWDKYCAAFAEISRKTGIDTGDSWECDVCRVEDAPGSPSGSVLVPVSGWITGEPDEGTQEGGAK